LQASIPYPVNTQLRQEIHAAHEVLQVRVGAQEGHSGGANRGLVLPCRLVFIEESAGAIRCSGRAEHSETMLSGDFAALGMKNARTEIGQTDALAPAAENAFTMKV
jgi:hypothetical protein